MEGVVWLREVVEGVFVFVLRPLESFGRAEMVRGSTGGFMCMHHLTNEKT